MAATVTSKGQVTIPKPVRDLLGIKPGNTVDFQRAPDGRGVLVKVGGKQRPIRFAPCAVTQARGSAPTLLWH